jgi:hypothetical protein
MTLNQNHRQWGDLRLLRIARTLPVAAIPFAIALVLTGIYVFNEDRSSSETTFDDYLWLATFAVAITIISGGLHLGLARIRGFASRRQALVWGVFTSLLIAAGFFGIALAPSPALWVRAAPTVGVLCGLVFLPAGLLGGSVYWRLGIRPVSPPRAAKPDPVDRLTLTPRHRRWRDLHAGRLLLGLAIAPLIVTILLCLAWVIDGEMASEEIIAATIGILIFATAYWQVGGWGYLLVVTRTRRRIARIECVILGVALVDLVPPLLLVLLFTIDGKQGAAAIFGGHEPSALIVSAAVAIATILFAPIGLLNGWLFWRVGVRPAPMPHPDVSAVFD